MTQIDPFRFIAGVSSMRMLVLGVASWALAVPVVSAGDEWVGGKFMPRPGFRLMVGTERIPAEHVGLPMRARRVSGDWLWVGRAWVRKADVVPLDQAADFYTELIKQRPRSAWAYNCRGIVYKEEGQLEQALADYSTALRYRPDSETVLNNRGIVFRMQGDSVRALRDFNEALTYRPGFVMALVNRASMYYQAGDLAKAHADLNDALAANPDNPMALNNRGNVLALLERFDEALQDYDRALAIEPELAVAHNNRGWILAAAHVQSVRNGQQAIAAATRACELSGWQWHRHLQTLAAACAEAGDYESAHKWQARAVALLESRPPLRDLAQRRLNHYQAGKKPHELLRRWMPPQAPPPDESGATEPAAPQPAADRPEGTGTLRQLPEDLEEVAAEILGTG